MASTVNHKMQADRLAAKKSSFAATVKNLREYWMRRSNSHTIAPTTQAFIDEIAHVVVATEPAPPQDYSAQVRDVPDPLKRLYIHALQTFANARVLHKNLDRAQDRVLDKPAPRKAGHTGECGKCRVARCIVHRVVDEEDQEEEGGVEDFDDDNDYSDEFSGEESGEETMEEERIESARNRAVDE
jgi:hypothetical protein